MSNRLHTSETEGNRQIGSSVNDLFLQTVGVAMDTLDEANESSESPLNSPEEMKELSLPELLDLLKNVHGLEPDEQNLRATKSLKELIASRLSNPDKDEIYLDQNDQRFPKERLVTDEKAAAAAKDLVARTLDKDLHARELTEKDLENSELVRALVRTITERMANFTQIQQYLDKHVPIDKRNNQDEASVRAVELYLNLLEQILNYLNLLAKSGDVTPVRNSNSSPEQAKNGAKLRDKIKRGFAIAVLGAIGAAALSPTQSAHAEAEPTTLVMNSANSEEELNPHTLNLLNYSIDLKLLDLLRTMVGESLGPNYVANTDPDGDTNQSAKEAPAKVPDVVATMVPVRSAAQMAADATREFQKTGALAESNAEPAHEKDQTTVETEMPTVSFTAEEMASWLALEPQKDVNQTSYEIRFAVNADGSVPDFISTTPGSELSKTIADLGGIVSTLNRYQSKPDTAYLVLLVTKTTNSDNSIKTISAQFPMFLNSDYVNTNNKGEPQRDANGQLEIIKKGGFWFKDKDGNLGYIDSGYRKGPDAQYDFAAMIMIDDKLAARLNSMGVKHDPIGTYVPGVANYNPESLAPATVVSVITEGANSLPVNLFDPVTGNIESPVATATKAPQAEVMAKPNPDLKVNKFPANALDKAMPVSSVRILDVTELAPTIHKEISGVLPPMSSGWRMKFSDGTYVDIQTDFPMADFVAHPAKFEELLSDAGIKLPLSNNVRFQIYKMTDQMRKYMAQDDAVKLLDKATRLEAVFDNTGKHLDYILAYRQIDSAGVDVIKMAFSQNYFENGNRIPSYFGPIALNGAQPVLNGTPIYQNDFVGALVGALRELQSTNMDGSQAIISWLFTSGHISPSEAATLGDRLLFKPAGLGTPQ